MDGHAVAHGAPDPGDLPVRRLLNYVWWWATRNAEEKEKTKFKNRIWQPPVGTTAAEIPERSPWSPKNEAAAIGSLKASLGSGGKAQK